MVARSFPFARIVTVPATSCRLHSVLQLGRTALVESQAKTYTYMTGNFVFFRKDAHLTVAHERLASKRADGVRQVILNAHGLVQMTEATLFKSIDRGEWAHFYLYPSVIDAEAFLSLGEWGDESDSFVREFAQRFMDASFTTDYVDTFSFEMN
jgi:hypothetical protein